MSRCASHRIVAWAACHAGRARACTGRPRVARCHRMRCARVHACNVSGVACAARGAHGTCMHRSAARPARPQLIPQRGMLHHAMSSVGAPAARNEKPNDDTTCIAPTLVALTMLRAGCDSFAARARRGVGPRVCGRRVAMSPRSRSVAASRSRRTARQLQVHMAAACAGRSTHVCAPLCAQPRACAHMHWAPLHRPFVCASCVRVRKRCVFQHMLFMMR